MLPPYVTLVICFQSAAPLPTVVAIYATSPTVSTKICPTNSASSVGEATPETGNNDATAESIASCNTVSQSSGAEGGSTTAGIPYSTCVSIVLLFLMTSSSVSVMTASPSPARAESTLSIVQLRTQVLGSPSSSAGTSSYVTPDALYAEANASVGRTTLMVNVPVGYKSTHSVTSNS